MILFAGPCALLPDHERMLSLADNLKKAGADVFRAGLWKGGTFPPALGSSAWGVGQLGVATMEEISKRGMPVCTEIRNWTHAVLCNRFSHVWTPARSMQTYDMIRSIAEALASPSPTIPAPPDMMIKRGTGATLRDCLGIIEHVKQVGYPTSRLWFIERGISGMGYTDVTRWRPDLLIVPQLKEKYPEVRVCVDVSHSTGTWEYVLPVARASKGIGADGIMVEVLDRPADSPSDSQQTIDMELFKKLAGEMK